MVDSSKKWWIQKIEDSLKKVVDSHIVFQGPSTKTFGLEHKVKQAVC